MKMIADKQLCISFENIAIYEEYGSNDYEQCNRNFLSLFKKLCETVFTLLIKYQIPIDIKLKFSDNYIDELVDKCIIKYRDAIG